MARVLVTGAAGFVGRALVRRLATEDPGLDLVLTDRSDAEATISDRSRWHGGDIGDPALLERLFDAPLDTIYHLAGVVSGAAEADYGAGKHVNLDATIALLERCRQQAQHGGPVPRFVYASSIAVFGPPLPARLDDASAPVPTLSYGTHKRACELLIDDCTRRGFIDGRALRLPGIVVRPPLANGALSGFNSDLIREPLAGRDYVCPVSARSTLWIASLPQAVGNLLRLGHVGAERLGPRRALTMPALAVSVAQIVDALRAIDVRAAARIRHRPDPAIEAQFGRWPLDCSFEQGRALGLTVDASIDAVVRSHREPS